MVGKYNGYVIFERIEYMRNILEIGESFSREDIESQFEISRPTFFRDIEFMRNRLKLEIRCKDGRYSL